MSIRHPRGWGGPLAVLSAALACAGPLRAGATAAPSESRFEVVQAVLPEAVRLHVFAAGRLARTGSAVCLRDDRTAHRSYLLTNAHVVDAGGLPGRPSYEALVEGPRGTARAFPARLLAVGSVPDTDLAVLVVQGADVPAALLAEGDGARVGEDVVIVGAPFGRELSVSGGLVSSLEWVGDGAARALDRLKTDAAIGYGTSGGGIFRVRDGRLVALVEGYRTARVELPDPAAEGTAPGHDVAAAASRSAPARRWGFDVPMPGETFGAPAAKIRRFLAAHGLAALGR